MKACLFLRSYSSTTTTATTTERDCVLSRMSLHSQSYLLHIAHCFVVAEKYYCMSNLFNTCVLIQVIHIDLTM